MMVLQFYQMKKMVQEIPDADSGAIDLSKLNPGRIEIKIWKPGDESPADSIWVTIRLN
jgi:hypothetical protein